MSIEVSSKKKQLLGTVILLLASYGSFQLVFRLQREPTLQEIMARVERGDFDQGLSRLARILQISPRDAAARNALGTLYLKLNLPQEAIKQFELAGHAATEEFANSKAQLHRLAPQ